MWKPKVTQILIVNFYNNFDIKCQKKCVVSLIFLNFQVSSDLLKKIFDDQNSIVNILMINIIFRFYFEVSTG